MMTTTSIDVHGQRASTAVAKYGSLIRSNRLKRSLTDSNHSASFTFAHVDTFVALHGLPGQLPSVPYSLLCTSVFLHKQPVKNGSAMQGRGGDDVLFGEVGDDGVCGDRVALPGRLDTKPAAQRGSAPLLGGKSNDSLAVDGGSNEHSGGSDKDTLHGYNQRAGVTLPDAQLDGADMSFGGTGANTSCGARIKSCLWPVLALCLFAVASSARADWSVLGAAYKCKAGESFELRATVDTSSPNDPGTVRPGPGFTALKQDEPSRLFCVAGRNQVEAIVHVWSPRAKGTCAGSGDVSIESLLVDGRRILNADEPFNRACPSGPAIVSVRVQGASLRVCRGEWDWGKGYQRVKCIDSKTQLKPKLIAQ